MYDGPHDKGLIAITEKLWEEGKVVASVCHGPAGLVGVRNPDGTPIVNGRKVIVQTLLSQLISSELQGKIRNYHNFCLFLLAVMVQECGHFSSSVEWPLHS